MTKVVPVVVHHTHTRNFLSKLQVPFQNSLLLKETTLAILCSLRVFCKNHATISGNTEHMHAMSKRTPEGECMQGTHVMVVQRSHRVQKRLRVPNASGIFHGVLRLCSGHRHLWQKAVQGFGRNPHQCKECL